MLASDLVTVDVPRHYDSYQRQQQQPQSGHSADACTADPFFDAKSKTFLAGDGVVALAVSGSNVWLALSNGGMEVRDAHSGVTQHIYAAPTRGRPAATTRIWSLLAITSPEQHHPQQVWVGLSTGTIEVYSGASYVLVRQLRKHLAGVYCLAAEHGTSSTDGVGAMRGAAAAVNHVAYSGSSDFHIAQWHVADGALLRVFKGHANYVRCLFAEGAALVSGSDDGTVRVWESATGNVLGVGAFHAKANAQSAAAGARRGGGGGGGGVSALCRVGVNMWSGDESGVLAVWRLKDCVALLVSRPHEARITALRKVGSQVYSAGGDGTICVYAALDGTLSQRLRTQGSGARVMDIACAVEVNRYYIWTGAADNTVRCWHHDEHTPMTGDRERFTDMRWYYATTQPFRESNEALLEEQRELAELVVLTNGSDDAVKAYLSRNEEESQTAAARYWRLENQVREAQEHTQRMEAERVAVQAALAAKQQALQQARMNLQRMTEAQQALQAQRSAAAAPTSTTTTTTAATTATGTGVGVAALPSLGPPAVPGASVPAATTTTTTTTTTAAVTAPVVAPTALTPAPQLGSVSVIPSSTVPVAPSATLGSTGAVTATTAATAPGASASLAPLGPMATLPSQSLRTLLSTTTAGSTLPLPTAAAGAGASTTTLSSITRPPPPPPTTTAAHSPGGGDEVKIARSTSYEPDLSSLPPPPPPAAAAAARKSVSFNVPVPLSAQAIAAAPAGGAASTAALGGGAGPLSVPTSPTAAKPLAPPPPTTKTAASPHSFVVPPPPGAAVPPPPPPGGARRRSM